MSDGNKIEIFLNGKRILAIVNVTKPQLEYMLWSLVTQKLTILWFGIGPRVEHFIAELLYETFD